MRAIFLLALAGFAFTEGAFTPFTRINRYQFSSFATETSKFSLNLYKTIVGSRNENLVISPVSVQTALGLAYMGADGTTAEQMSTVMHLSGNRNSVGDSYKELLDHHRQSSAVKIANKIFLDQKYSPKPEFTSLVTNKFYSTAQTINTVNSQEAASTINSWVEEKTNNKIRDLVKPTDVENATSVLVNAVYFKADWVQGFSKTSTRKEDFWTSASTSKKVDMMYQTQNFEYGEFNGMKAVRLRYKDTDLSLLVILPHEREGLAAIEANIDQFDLSFVLNRLWSQKVNLALPKLKTESKAELAPTLSQMGMTEMFSNNADFSKMSEASVKISAVIHKALIEIDEEGTVAAAATAVVMAVTYSARPPDLTKDFIADHPFLYMLVDSQGHIFFIGRYVQ